jgi:hypothetical protein
VTCSIPGLPSNRSLDWLIVVRVQLDLKWCLCGFDLPLGWRRDLCAIVHQYIALLNRLHYCSCFRSVCTPLLPKVVFGVRLSSITLCLLFILVFVCHFLARLRLQLNGACVLNLKQFSMFAALHP